MQSNEMKAKHPSFSRSLDRFFFSSLFLLLMTGEGLWEAGEGFKFGLGFGLSYV